MEQDFKDDANYLGIGRFYTSTDQKNGVRRRGKLKIFFGMSPGVGKTYSMLQMAHQDLERGVDVVIGYMESHNYRETEALLKGFEIIPRHNNTGSKEMDLDAILARHPQLVIIDQLAHTNATGSHHVKRYQDVHELLDNGINVYTTLNLGNLESRSELVARITGITVTEIVPDEVLEITDDVELIDITSTAFLDRLNHDEIYNHPRMQGLEQSFFKKENIIVLREMALRAVADRVDEQFKSYVQQKQLGNPLDSGWRLLVLIGESNSSINLLHRAKKYSYTIGAKFYALHIDNGQVSDEWQRNQLAKNIDLARSLGAEMIITTGKDIVFTALDVAHKENITHIVIGKPQWETPLSRILSGGGLLNRLLLNSGAINIHILQPEYEKRRRGRRGKRRTPVQYKPSSYKHYIFTSLAVLLTVLAYLPLASTIGFQSISFILLFVLLLLSLSFRLGPVMLAMALSVFAWDFFFVPPLYRMTINNHESMVEVFSFFIIVLVTVTLMAKVRQREKLIRKREERAYALFRLTNQLAEANIFEEVISIAKREISRYFGVDSYFILQNNSGALVEDMDTAPDSFFDSDFGIAQWAFKNSKKAGRYTDILSASEYTFYPLGGVYTKTGVVAVKEKMKFSGETELFWNTFLAQISAAIERYYYSLRMKEAILLSESDKLYKNLFNSVSHELRTPVATIMGSADTLLDNEYPEEVRRQLYTEIFTASNRLNRLIENLLNISRIENKKIAPSLDWLDMNDLFNRVVSDLREDLEPFHMDISVPASMPMVKLDFGLMELALYNLVDNSCKYAEPGTTIRLKALYDDGYLIIQEMNRGASFSPEDLTSFFGKFYRANGNVSGGLGLGLSIAKGFIESHNGTISVENRRRGGVRFTIKIPTEVSHIV